MNEEDRRLLAETVSVMNGLRSDMQEFPGRDARVQAAVARAHHEP